MKSIVKGIIAFVLSQVIIDVIFGFFAFGIKHPFAFMFNTDDASGYLLASSVLFIPVYFILGFLCAKVFKLNTKNVIVSTIISGTVFLTGLWLFFVIAMNADHSTVLLYAMLNIPAGWAYMPISNTAGYMNFANLFFTVLPPVAFSIGIYLWQRKTKKKQEIINMIVQDIE